MLESKAPSAVKNALHLQIVANNHRVFTWQALSLFKIRSMETRIIGLKNDIQLFYLQASSYPQGISQAHEEFRQKIKNPERRVIYGVSRPEGQRIIYRVGAEAQVPGESALWDQEPLVLKKGRYAAIDITNYLLHLGDIGKAFDKLLSRPDIDPEGYCVEKYEPENKLTCMVRLAN